MISAPSLPSTCLPNPSHIPMLKFICHNAYYIPLDFQLRESIPAAAITKGHILFVHQLLTIHRAQEAEYKSRLSPNYSYILKIPTYPSDCYKRKCIFNCSLYFSCIIQRNSRYLQTFFNSCF